MAGLLVKRGDIEQALEAAFFVLDHPAINQDTRERAAHLRAQLEPQLTSKQVDETRASARTLDALVEDALKKNLSIP